MNDLVKISTDDVVAQWERPEVLKARIGRMMELMSKVMKEGSHYGKIPGVKQNSLFQPGSQLLSVSFRIGHEPYKIEDLSTEDEKHYRVTDRVFDQVTGITLGYGVGECSSAEEKYAWKRTYIDEEFEATPIDRRKEKFSKKDNGGVFSQKMIRTNPADVANTVLKMARKRANVNGTIEVLAASEVFTQDVEDMEGMDFSETSSPNPKAGMSAPMAAPDDLPSQESDYDPTDDERKAAKQISHAQEKRLYAICKSKNVDPQNVKNWIAVIKKVPRGHFYLLSWSSPAKGKPSEYDKVCETLEKQPDYFQKYQTVQTQGEAPKTDPSSPPAQTMAQAQSPAQTSPNPSPFEQFEIEIQTIAESMGKTMLVATVEIQKAFKVDSLDKIDPSKYGEVKSYLANL